MQCYVIAAAQAGQHNRYGQGICTGSIAALLKGTQLILQHVRLAANDKAMAMR